MSRTKVWILVAILALFAGFIAAYSALPKRYSVGERLSQTNVFWNDHEAFFFLTTSTTGRVDNFLSEKLHGSLFAYFAFFLEGNQRFSDLEVRAYRLLPLGEWKQFSLPGKPTAYGDWTLVDGKLQLQLRASYDHRNGFRWNGDKFIEVDAQEELQNSRDTSRLVPDNDDEDDGLNGFLSSAARKQFKEQGWHYKQLPAYETRSSHATLPITMAGKSFDLTLNYFPQPTERADPFDFLNFGIKSIELSGATRPQTIWEQNGWQTVSKDEYEARAARSGRTAVMPYTIWIWLGLILFLGFWKFTGWLYLIGHFFGIKGRVLNSMATSYSFPPAMTSQFPQLDTSELERYTREFENLGFVRLLDFSLVPNTAKPIPSFCRLFSHTRNHCFAEVSQIFPPRKAPLPLRCSIQSCPQDGWTLSFSDRKPQAASAMLRRKKAISMSAPGTPTHELLQNFLQMRSQICHDLGISVVAEDTLEAYFAKVQRSATEMREAVTGRSLASTLPQFYYRKFALLKTKPEYVWLGDYPKVAEQRKSGFPAAAPSM